MIKQLFSLLCVGAFTAPTSLIAAHYKVYVLTGQSNSLGTTNQGTDDPSTPGTDTVDASIPFFWSNRSTSGGDGPSGIIGDSAGQITTLQTQQGEGAHPTFWGPEINFGRQLYKHGERDFLIIKGSRGGGGNGYWLQGAQMYNHVVDTVNSCVLDLTKDGHTFEIVGLLYLQGESNNSSEASVAGSRFASLLDNLKAELPNASNMRGYIGGIASTASKDDTTRAQQEAIAAARSDIEYFSTLDFQDQRGSDNLHYDKRAKLSIGARYAEAVLKCNGSYNADQFGDAYTPELHGWSRVDPYTAITGQSEASVSPDGTTGKNAWNITDASTGHRGYYYTRLFTDTENTNADTNGWHYQLRLRMLDNDNSGSATFFQYGNSTNRWVVGLDINGTALEANGIELQANHDGEYHTFDLVLTSGSTANLYFDGALVGTVSSASNGIDQGLIWGSASTGGQGYVNVNRINFSVLGDTTQPRLSEFQAINTSTIQDKDGDFSDWLEIENPGSSHIDLGGLHLTNDSGNLTLWTFPAGTFVAPMEKLVIFASAKNRTNPNGELHSNFTLAFDSGYLALVDSDGNTKLTEFTNYPVQYADTSYGLSSTQSLSLISPLSSGRYLVPSNDSLGTTWTGDTFDDSTWASAASGLGYDSGTPATAFSAAYDGDPDNDTGSAAPTPDANIWSQSGGSQSSSSDSTGWNILDNIAGQNGGISSSISASNFADMFATGWQWSARIRQVAESQILFWEVSSSSNPGWGSAAERVYFTISVSGADVVITDAENGANTHTITGGANQYFDLLVEGTANSSAGAYTVKIDGVQRWTGNITDSSAFGGSYSDKLHSISGTSGATSRQWDIASMELKSIGTVSPTTYLFSDYITTDLEATPNTLKNTNGGLYLRLPFYIDQYANDGTVDMSSLDLSILADDGYVAYLNGTQIGLDNTAVSPAYNAVATTDSDDSALAYQHIDLSAQSSLLKTGQNILAIHALNSDISAERFLVLPTLFSSRTQRESYFETPTPADTNAQVPGSALDAWKTSNGVTDTSQDTDSDGLDGLLEFVGGTDNSSNSDAWFPSAEIVTVDEADYIALRTRVPSNVGTVELQVHRSDDLVTWYNEDSAVTVSTTPIGSGIDEVLLRLPTDNSTHAGKQFLRAHYITQ